MTERMTGDVSPPPADGGQPASKESFFDRLKGFWRPRNGEPSVREALEELIEERQEADVPIDENERRLLANVLDIGGRIVHDVMVPRADIIAIDAGSPLAQVIGLISKEGHSRMPVYRNDLDDALGMVHIKDVVAWRGEDKDFTLPKVLRKVLFVSPSMRVLELLLEMRVKRSHMALVVDEFGGVDGLVTIEDLVEEIVGEIEDEHDRVDEPEIVRRPDGAFDIDARTTIESLEQEIGVIITDEEREHVDTVGGLVFALAGRVPIRGELVAHPSGIEFEVLEADPRRIKRLRLLAPPPADND